MGSKCSKTKEPEEAIIESKSSIHTSFKQNSLDHSFMQMVHIKEMLARSPEDTQLNLEMAMCLFHKNQLEESEVYFEVALRSSPKLNFNNMMAIGEIRRLREDFTSALDYFSEALRQDASSSLAHHKLYEVNSALGIPKELLFHLKEAAKLDPKNSEFQHELGLVYFNLNKFVKSELHFKKAIVLNPRSNKAHNNLGNAYRKLGVPDEAIKHYKLAIENTHKRKFPIAILNLATTYFDLGDLIKALDCFQEALHVGNNIHKMMVSKGYHLLLKTPLTRQGIEKYVDKEFLEAQKVLKTALNNDPRNPAIYYYLGCCYLENSKLHKARECFGKVIEIGRQKIHKEKHFVQYFVKQAGCKNKLILDGLPSSHEREDSLVSSFFPSDYSLNFT